MFSDGGYLLLLCALGVLTIYISENQKAAKIFIEDINRPNFLILLTLVTVVIVVGLTTENEKRRRSIRHAIIGLIIAYLAHVDLPWVVFFVLLIYFNIVPDKYDQIT